MENKILTTKFIGYCLGFVKDFLSTHFVWTLCWSGFKTSLKYYYNTMQLHSRFSEVHSSNNCLKVKIAQKTHQLWHTLQYVRNLEQK